MSRIGKKPVAIPAGVTAKLEGQTIAVKGAKGELKFTAPEEVSVTIDGNVVHVSRMREDKRARAMWGTTRAQVANLIGGVTKGFERKLEINGVGYKAAIAGKNLQLSLGYSHDILYPIPAGVTIVDAQADRDHGRWHRQEAGRPDRGRDPRVPRSRALQGQGREIRRRIHLPQGRQEEVRAPPWPSPTMSTERRKARVRRAIAPQAGGRPRLSVFRSSKQIYAQVIDDEQGAHARARRPRSRRCCARSSRPARRSKRRAASARRSPSGRRRPASTKVVFDRGGYMYHGRVKALAEGAREGGLEF